MYSLPYIDKSFQGKKVEGWLKIEMPLQGILEPIQTQTKQTFVNALGSVNQGAPVLRKDL